MQKITEKGSFKFHDECLLRASRRGINKFKGRFENETRVAKRRHVYLPMMTPRSLQSGSAFLPVATELFPRKEGVPFFHVVRSLDPRTGSL